MVALMSERKAKWNLYVWGSIAREFDQVVESDYRGDKGTTVSAACLMWLLAPPDERMRFMRLVREAELAGSMGTVAEAARQLAANAQRPEIDALSGVKRPCQSPAPSEPASPQPSEKEPRQRQTPPLPASRGARR
jgi:hypothetical protein